MLSSFLCWLHAHELGRMHLVNLVSVTGRAFYGSSQTAPHHGFQPKSTELISSPMSAKRNSLALCTSIVSSPWFKPCGEVSGSPWRGALAIVPEKNPDIGADWLLT